MNPRTILAALCGAAVIGLTLCAIAQNTPTAERMKLDSHRSLAAPRSFRNLTLIPVYDSTARSGDTWITLDEGLKGKVVRVTESKGRDEVNTLYVSNTGDRPLYLMAGEVVLGGQQDRCIGRDTIIPSGKRLVPITVFCVEHGRWTGRVEFGESAKMVASAGIRSDAQNGAFAAERPAASSRIAGRASVLTQRDSRPVDSGAVSLGRAQQQVWDSVAEKNAKFKAAPSTGTYRGVLNLDAGEAGRSVTPYLKAFAGGLGNDPQLSGVVAAVNGKVVAADIFGDPALFRKLWPKLLRSYAADAAEKASGAGRRVSAVTTEQARSFVIQASDAGSKAENKSDISTTLRLESKSSVTYRLVAASKPRAKGMAAEVPGLIVHENVLRK